MRGRTRPSGAEIAAVVAALLAQRPALVAATRPGRRRRGRIRGRGRPLDGVGAPGREEVGECLTCAEFVVAVEGAEVRVELDAAGGTARVAGGDPVGVSLAPTGQGGCFSLLLGAHSFEVAVETTPEGQRVWVDGEPYDVLVNDPRRPAVTGRRSVRTGTGARLVTPMPGLVAEVLVVVGDEVTKGQAVAVVEAMKMRNDVRSTRDGLVVQVAVTAGQTVAKGDVLVMFADV